MHSLSANRTPALYASYMSWTNCAAMLKVLLCAIPLTHAPIPRKQPDSGGLPQLSLSCMWQPCAASRAIVPQEPQSSSTSPNSV